MRKSAVLAAVLSAGLTSAVPAFAGDKADVTAVFNRISAALSACDIDRFAAQLDPQGSIYVSDNGPLHKLADDIAHWRRICAGGGHGNLTYTPERIELHGDWAVAQGLQRGSFTETGGTPDEMNLRVTAVVMKKRGAWKVHDVHLSPLTPVSASGN